MPLESAGLPPYIPQQIRISTEEPRGSPDPSSDGAADTPPVASPPAPALPQPAGQEQPAAADPAFTAPASGSPTPTPEDAQPRKQAAGLARYIQHCALAQIKRMGAVDRETIRRKSSPALLARLLGLENRPARLSLIDKAKICLREDVDQLPAVPDLPVEELDTLPADERLIWEGVRDVLAFVLQGPVEKIFALGRRIEARLPLNTPRALRAAEAAAARSAADGVRDQFLALLLTVDAQYLEDLRLMAFRLGSWHAVSMAWELSLADDASSMLERYMLGSARFRADCMARARAVLARRARDEALAQADEAALARLIRLLAALKAGEGQASRRESEQAQALDAFLEASSDFSVADLRACVVQAGGIDPFCRVMRLCTGNPLVREMAHAVDWRGLLPRHAAVLAARSQPGGGSALVGSLREQLAVLLQAARQQNTAQADAVPSKRIKPDPDNDDVEGLEVQRFSPHIRAATASGGDWLQGLALDRAEWSAAAWADFERHYLEAAALPRRARETLKCRLQAQARRLLCEPAAESPVPGRFQFVTTLDDGPERGQGVVSLQALEAFEVLFLYGGTVCADRAEVDAYHLRYPGCWRYAHYVGLADADCAELPAREATCFGYPEGNIAASLNARRLRGTPRELRQAANVAALLLRVPGLPFGLPVIVTVRAIRPGRELFLDYGVQFCHFVSDSLRPLPAWPRVKQEGGQRPAGTLEQFLSALDALPPPSGDAPASWQPQAGRPPSIDWRAWLERSGYQLRQLPAEGDACLLALSGGLLDAGQLQQLRHDLADATARQTDTPASGRRLARAMVEALNRSWPERPLPPQALRASLGHAAYAELQRVPGVWGGNIEIQAWCQLEDERKQARIPQGRRGAAPPTQVALIDAGGVLRVLTAGDQEVIDLRRLPEREGLLLVDARLSKSDVALLREDDRYSEILQGDQAAAAWRR
ncbi:hypothetical protein GT347_03675 [Xylophilus rhododendri]|uniref:SET domain-containing protein n=1 Tax=Xylophilus rhododendri TaxID=2697032 RepID=A0A857J2R1_9BURK|nr:SET domain-containing protein [Xylophilus rhododendri]QHI97155.1 hypothetical protein GT347_03675 [Xylophilus rhododendri]